MHLKIHTLDQEMFLRGRGRNFSPRRTVKKGSRLPREVLQSLTFKVFKTGLDETLSSLI